VFATVIVENIADATAVAGADELNYEINIISSGTLVGSSTGIDQPLNGGNEHFVELNTSASGQAVLELEVTSSSQGVGDGYYHETFSYYVEDVNLNGFTQTWLLGEGDQGFDDSYDFYEDDFVNFLDFVFLN
jgi:hypothetical protein